MKRDLISVQRQLYSWGPSWNWSMGRFVGPDCKKIFHLNPNEIDNIQRVSIGAVFDFTGKGPR